MRDGVRDDPAATTFPQVTLAMRLGQGRLVDARAAIGKPIGASEFHARVRRALLERWLGPRVHRETGTWRPYRHDSESVAGAGARR